MINSKNLTMQENNKLNEYMNNLRGEPSLAHLNALFEMCRFVENKDSKLAHKISINVVRKVCIKILKDKSRNTEDRQRAFLIRRKSLFFSARVDFDSFMQYMEIDRPVEQRFWIHRRNTLLPIANALQELAGGLLDMLFVELPPRTGKSTLGTWFLTWFGGNYPDLSNLAVGHTVKLVKSFYTEIDNLTVDQKYKFFEIFPEVQQSYKTFAKDLMLNFGTPGRYRTFSFVSPDTPMSGVVEVTGILYLDDLMEGLEEAMNPDRVEKKWMQLNTDIMQRRANSKIRVLNIGTPWTKGDPAERLYDHFKDDKNYKIKRIQIPATDAEGHSNFNYSEKYEIGFTDQFYDKLSQTMDNVSYQTVYMLNRVDRDGLLFDEKKFPLFSKELLTSRHPDRKHSFSDVAWGGGDYYSMPITYEYDREYYLADVMFNAGNKDVTRPLVAAKAKQHSLKILHFEKNNGGHEYADKIDENLRAINYYANIKVFKRKNVRDVKRFSIVLYASEIQKVHLLEIKDRSKEYQSFVNNLISYNQNGKNRHDDAADSMALLFEFCIFGKDRKVRIIERERRLL